MTSGLPTFAGGALSVRPLAAALALFSLVGCRELFVEPAVELPAALSLSLGLHSAGEGAGATSLGAAFDAADGVRIRLLRGSAGVIDVERTFSPEGEATPVSVEVRLEGPEESLRLELSLLFRGDPVFEAARSVTLRTGETTAAEVTLTPVPARVEIAPGPLTLEAIGEEGQLSAVVVFATGDDIPGLPVTWTSAAPDVVQVDATGRVTAVASGPAEVRATHEQLEASVTVTVEQTTASVTVDPEQAELSAIGQELPLEARAFDANGHPIALAATDFTWTTSDESVVTVSPDGTASAEGAGTATISAARGGHEGHAFLSVIPRAEAVTVEPAQAEIVGIGNTLTLSATATDAAGVPIPLEPTDFEWSSSNETVATVSAEGVVTARDEGTAIITAARDDAQGTSVLSVERLVQNVTVDPAEAEAGELGQTVAFTARAFDATGNLLTSDPADFQWASSHTSVATVSSAGVATVTGSGTATINATREGRTGFAELHASIPVPVNFPDPNLEAAVRAHIDKPTGTIFDTDLENLFELFAAEADIASLVGLEFATALEMLHLNANSISDLSPLSGLTQLTSLAVGSNLVSDLTPIAGLTALTELDVTFNEITDLTPIQGMTALDFLGFGGNAVSDLSPLGGMLALEMLIAFGNSISDLAPLEGLTALGHLDLQANQIVEIGALVANSGLGEGDFVNLSENPLGTQALCQHVPELLDREVIVLTDGGCP